MDLLMARDITENAFFEIMNVSADKRSLKETKTFYLNECILDEPYNLRIFSIYDVL